MSGRALLLAALGPLSLSLLFCSATKENILEENTGKPDKEDQDGGAAGGPSDAGVGFDTGTNDSGGGPMGGDCPGELQSFIWVANTGDGTLSKICTVNGQEVARYLTSDLGATGDPSRTSVNLHGDMVVTNRAPTTGPSSVTKFAGNDYDCIDRNNNGQIDTSHGPTDVLPWGEDECMIWNTPLGGAMGARATAWDGTEDPATGLGGHVYVGATLNRTIYKLDGDDGQLLDQAVTALRHYGGAVDNKGNLWTVDMACTVGLCSIERISLNDLNNHETHSVNCGYGISVDAKGRVWTAGGNFFNGGGCISRFDPVTKENVWTITGNFDFNRGVAVGYALSAGSVWATATAGDLIQIDMETMAIVKRQPIGKNPMVGVAIDFEGYVWTVSKGSGTAHKVHPLTWEQTPVEIGSSPYTYSDMTGVQLLGAVKPPN